MWFRLLFVFGGWFLVNVVIVYCCCCKLHASVQKRLNLILSCSCSVCHSAITQSCDRLDLVFLCLSVSGVFIDSVFFFAFHTAIAILSIFLSLVTCLVISLIFSFHKLQQPLFGRVWRFEKFLAIILVNIIYLLDFCSVLS